MEHLRRPLADAAHISQLGDDFGILHARPGVDANAPGDKMRRQVDDVLDLARRQAAGAQFLHTGVSTASGTSSGRAAETRAQTLSAALTEICCPTIERTRVENGAPREETRVAPA